jgi:hypothetical protein
MQRADLSRLLERPWQLLAAAVALSWLTAVAVAIRADVDVGAREHMHIRQRCRGRRIDGDAGVREHRAHEGDREPALERQVLDVAALTVEEASVLCPQDAIAQDAHKPTL